MIQSKPLSKLINKRSNCEVSSMLDIEDLVCMLLFIAFIIALHFYDGDEIKTSQLVNQYKCTFVKENGSTCKNDAKKGTSLCGLHKNGDKRLTCEFVSVYGHHCNNHAKAESRYCGLHVGGIDVRNRSNHTKHNTHRSKKKTGSKKNSDSVECRYCGTVYKKGSRGGAIAQSSFLATIFAPATAGQSLFAIPFLADDFQHMCSNPDCISNETGGWE